MIFTNHFIINPPVFILYSWCLVLETKNKLREILRPIADEMNLYITGIEFFLTDEECWCVCMWMEILKKACMESIWIAVQNFLGNLSCFDVENPLMEHIPSKYLHQVQIGC